jgi:hypothetical protein
MFDIKLITFIWAARPAIRRRGIARFRGVAIRRICRSRSKGLHLRGNGRATNTVVCGDEEEE